jgi:hypothetical protein
MNRYIGLDVHAESCTLVVVSETGDDHDEAREIGRAERGRWDGLPS